MSEPRAADKLRDKAGGSLDTGQSASGIQAARPLRRLSYGIAGTCRPDAKGAAQAAAPQVPEYRCGAQGRRVS